MAIEAMKAVIAKTKLQNELLIAERAYMLADAMLGEREKSQNPKFDDVRNANRCLRILIVSGCTSARTVIAVVKRRS